LFTQEGKPFNHFGLYKISRHPSICESFKTNAPKERDRKIDKAELLRLPDEHPDWYLREFAEAFGVWQQSVQKMFVKPGVTRKKNIYLF
jgi:hypothetical protein